MSADFRQNSAVLANTNTLKNDYMQGNKIQMKLINKTHYYEESSGNLSSFRHGLKALAQTLPELSLPTENLAPTRPNGEYTIGGIVSGRDFATQIPQFHKNASIPAPFGTTLPTIAFEIANISLDDDCTSSDGVGAGGSNCSTATNTTLTPDFSGHPDKQFWALILILFPLLTVFGNVLVIVSVYKERTLRNVTNYFIVSLAFADLLVASVVMPFFVYYMVSKYLFYIYYTFIIYVIKLSIVNCIISIYFIFTFVNRLSHICYIFTIYKCIFITY